MENIENDTLIIIKYMYPLYLFFSVLLWYSYKRENFPQYPNHK